MQPNKNNLFLYFLSTNIVIDIILSALFSAMNKGGFIGFFVGLFIFIFLPRALYSNAKRSNISLSVENDNMIYRHGILAKHEFSVSLKNIKVTSIKSDPFLNIFNLSTLVVVFDIPFRVNVSRDNVSVRNGEVISYLADKDEIISLRDLLSKSKQEIN